MTRTDNLNLCTWVGDDPVSMEEMNENFRTLDAAGGRSDALLEPLLWNTAGAMLDTMRLGASGKYREGMLCDIFRDSTGIEINNDVDLKDNSASVYSLQGMTKCGYKYNESRNPSPTGTGCSYLDVKSDSSGPSETEIMAFTPYGNYQVTSLYLYLANSAFDEQDILLKNDAGETIWQTHTTETKSERIVTVAIATPFILSRQERYHLYLRSTRYGVNVTFFSLYFNGTEVVSDSAMLQSKPVQIPAGCTQVRAMLRVASPADIGIKLIAGDSQATMQRATAEDDVLPNGTACKLLRCSCALPQGSEQAAVQLTLGAVAAKIYDYALIFV